VDVVIERFGVYLALFDPAVGAEIRKTRPCLVISPDAINRNVRTVIVAPMTGTRRGYPFRVDCVFDGRPGQIALDQLRSFDKQRFVRRLGTLDARTATQVLRTLRELFR
jgi:mRNA interferase MazF